MTQVQSNTNESVKSTRAGIDQGYRGPIDQILKDLSRIELPAEEHFKCYIAPQVAPELQA